jgi:hypothetical protein
MFNTAHPTLLEEVRVYNFPGNVQANVMANNLTLSTKLKKVPRDAIINVLRDCNQSDTMPIFVCHQMMNSLNYLYYELLYYGYPLVHNSPDLDGCGYRYSGYDVEQLSDAILTAYKHHDRSIETYKLRARTYLKRVDPNDPDVRNTFEQALKSSVVKSP